MVGFSTKMNIGTSKYRTFSVRHFLHFRLIRWNRCSVKRSCAHSCGSQSAAEPLSSPLCHCKPLATINSCYPACSPGWVGPLRALTATSGLSYKRVWCCRTGWKKNKITFSTEVMVENIGHAVLAKCKFVALLCGSSAGWFYLVWFHVIYHSRVVNSRLFGI